MSIKIGASAELTRTANEPPPEMGSSSRDVGVLPISALAGLMEAACVMAVEFGLGDDETTIGAGLSVQQLTPTPVGSRIVVAAEVVSLSRNKVHYKVSAKNGSGTVAVGEHTRFLVNKTAFTDQLTNKAMMPL
jgi:fluoroacetyl-CoA thioesterase